MRIAIDTRLLGSFNHSGVEEYAYNIANELLTKNSTDQFILFHNGIRIQPLSDHWLSKENITIINWHLPNKLLDLASRFNLIKAKFNADIFFSPNLSSIQTKMPHIVTIHDLSFIHYPEFFTPLARAWNLTRIKLQAQKADHIITDSNFTKNDLINSFKILPEKISVVYLGIDEQFKKLASNDERLTKFKNKLNLNFPFILYLGTLEPRKNIPAIIRAFNILKQNNTFKYLRLILAGKKGWLYHDILKEAEKSKFKNDILFFGPVKTDERVLLYNLSKVFVYPSFFEGFGLPPLEAQACGIPVIASDRTSLSENLTESATLINPWKITDLALAIEKALTENKEREMLIANGLANSKRFTWAKTGQMTSSIFKKYART